jgi:hypothetical protein
MAIVTLRTVRNRDRGVSYYSLRVPQGIGDHVPGGQRYEVQQFATGAILFTPVTVLQPPLPPG